MKTLLIQLLQVLLFTAFLGLFYNAPNFVAVLVYGSAIFTLALLTALLLLRYGSVVTINVMRIDIAIAWVSALTGKVLAISLVLFLLQLVVRSFQQN